MINRENQREHPQLNKEKGVISRITRRREYKMKSIENKLIKELQELEKIAATVTKRLQSAPKGHLRISAKGKEVEYYYKMGKNDSKKNGRYMKKSEMKLVKGIVQRDYDMHLLAHAKDRIKAINTFLKKYKKTDLAAVYEKMKPHRKELITYSVIPDEEYARIWQNTAYEGKTFDEEAAEIITERGERVRSKSEKIIADKLNLLGIPYKYECPMLLEGHIWMYPDFTILNVATREEIYLEHFGLMDNKDYVDNMIYKLKTYERSNIYLGVNLFITYETGKYPLNVKMFETLIRKLAE